MAKSSPTCWPDGPCALLVERGPIESLGPMTEPTEPSPPLILFSGLASDATVFASQVTAFPALIVPTWPMPAKKETLSQYCQRIAETILPQTPCIIGGVSFGGIVALELARYTNPVAIVLIGSIRSPREMPWRARIFRPLAPLMPFLPVKFIQDISGTLLARPVRAAFPNLANFVELARDAERRTLRWSLQQLLQWRNESLPKCPIYQIHGDRDIVFPISCTQPETIVRGGGHLISMTHPNEVNAFLKKCLQAHTSQAVEPSPSSVTSS